MVERERVSALMDGELDSDQGPGFERVLKDEGAAECWRDYHLIGDLMRGEAGLSSAFSARVASALAAEPTVLAPQRSRPAGSARVRTFALSAAASVAGVAVVVLLAMQGIRSPENGNLAKVTPTGSQTDGTGKETPVAVKVDPDVIEFVAAHQEMSPHAPYVRTDYAR
jgi:sigma-E factor negative regulatory protein RseA